MRISLGLLKTTTLLPLLSPASPSLHSSVVWACVSWLHVIPLTTQDSSPYWPTRTHVYRKIQVCLCSDAKKIRKPCVNQGSTFSHLNNLYFPFVFTFFNMGRRVYVRNHCGFTRSLNGPVIQEKSLQIYTGPLTSPSDLCNLDHFSEISNFWLLVLLFLSHWIPSLRRNKDFYGLCEEGLSTCFPRLSWRYCHMLHSRNNNKHFMTIFSSFLFCPLWKWGLVDWVSFFLCVCQSIRSHMSDMYGPILFKLDTSTECTGWRTRAPHFVLWSDERWPTGRLAAILVGK